MPQGKVMWFARLIPALFLFLEQRNNIAAITLRRIAALIFQA